MQRSLRKRQRSCERMSRPDADGPRGGYSVSTLRERTGDPMEFKNPLLAVADMERSVDIRLSHLNEAVCYRSMDERFWGGQL